MERYYYLDARGQQQGPVEASQLRGLGVTSGTYVWREGMADWQRAGELAELAQYVDAAYAPGSAPQPSYQAYMVPPSSNMVWAILSTIFCCIPTGIYAIICAAKVESLWYAGRYEEAQRMSRKAGLWSAIGVGTNVVVWVLYMIIFGMAGLAGITRYDMI